MLFAFISGTAAYGMTAERFFRPARHSRDNTNLTKLQPIDSAKWIWHPNDDRMADGEATVKTMVFEKTFTAEENELEFELDVSADERFYLTLDGEFVARGPNRGTVENWQYESYRVKVEPGEHVMRAVVTRLGSNAPLAQLSWRGGFILKASGAYDAKLTTGKAKWLVGESKAMRAIGKDNGVWGTGAQFEITGRGPYVGKCAEMVKPKVVRDEIKPNSHRIWGGRQKGWMLFPSQLPDQTEFKVAPGEFKALTREAPWRGKHIYDGGDFSAPELASLNSLLKRGEKFTVPAHSKFQTAWDLADYYCAYPVLKTARGKGSKIAWCWTESTRSDQDQRKHNRGELKGKFLEGYGDVFLPDGDDGEFSAPWFRAGRWCRLDVETGDEELDLVGLQLVESRYPLEMESAFESPERADFADIRKICTRAQQMCSHEMLFDCPYYEQQMYPGDTRVQLLTIGALTRDDRLVKRAIEMYDLATRDDGQAPFNWPTRGTQEGFTYTLCYLAMFGDYATYHGDRDWLRARMPGMRKSMAGCELYENAEGLVEHTPGWNFMDWTVEWNGSSVPGSDYGYEMNSFINLFWLLDMQSAAKTERALGNIHLAEHWEAKAEHLKAKIVEKFWSEKRGLLADTPAKKTFSEHSQALAIITDCLPIDKRDVCFGHLVADTDIARTTVYFNFYLFEAYFKMGRADLFLKRLDLWREYLALDVKALLEAPDNAGKNGQIESRSDCHAWGSHPVYFMQTGLAGIRSAAPFFEKVLVAPQPGDLKSLKCRHPNPKGWIEVDLTFAEGAASGTVSTPVPGTFVFGTRTIDLHPGLNEIGL